MLSLASALITVQIGVRAGNTVAHQSASFRKRQPRLEELDSSAALECHDVEAEFLEPFLDLACVRGVSEHPRATAHRDQGILARASTGNA